MNACPGNCGQEDKIDFLKRKFPSLSPEEITQKIKEVNEIDERMKYGQKRMKSNLANTPYTRLPLFCTNEIKE